MAKHYLMVCGVLMCTVSLSLVSGCRAFSSTYESPEADLIANPPKNPGGDAAVSKPPAKPGANPSDSAPLTPDYSKDTTECKTPEGVTVGKNPEALVSNYGWALPVDGEQVTVTATKKGLHSATITIQKDLPNQSSAALSFVVKQTAVDKFSACNFSYSEGANRVYQGITGNLMIDRVNAVGKPESLNVNSGSFEFKVSRVTSTSTATKIQALYLGANLPTAVAATDTALDGIYFTDALVESSSK